MNVLASRIGRMMLGVVLIAGSTALAQAQEAAQPAANAAAEPAPALPRKLTESGPKVDQLRSAVLEVVTEQQRKDVEELFALAQERIAALMKQAQEDKQVRREVAARVLEITEDLREGIREILTDEQSDILKNGPARATTLPTLPAKTPDRIQQNLAKLNLSEEQKARLRTVQAEIRVKFAQLRTESRQDKQAMRQKLPELMQETRTKLGEILKPEQMVKLRQLMREEGVDEKQTLRGWLRDERGAAAGVKARPQNAKQ